MIVKIKTWERLCQLAEPVDGCININGESFTAMMRRELCGKEIDAHPDENFEGQYFFAGWSIKPWMIETMVTREQEIENERTKKYGNFQINMKAMNKVLEGMLMQHFQLDDVKLPDNFSAMFMTNAKIIRECYSHDDDNGLDGHNYFDCARRLSGEKDG